MNEATLYRRPLPHAQIAFASDRGRAIFAQALSANTMEGYFRLAQQLHTQSEPAYCGLGSLVMALNALDIDPGRLWRGPWRWFSEELLDCCVPLAQVQERGLTLDEVACLARCNGAHAQLYRPDEGHDLSRLREHLLQASQDAQGPILLVSYDRSALGQTGQGHFSPLGGYWRDEDLALIMDVARFKYPPHWTPLEQLYQAMCAPDSSTGRSRGWIMLTKSEARPSLFASISCAHHSWREIARSLNAALPQALAAASTPEARLARYLDWLKQAPLALELRPTQDDAHAQLIDTIQTQLAQTHAYAHISAHAPALSPLQAQLATLLWLALSAAQPQLDAHDLARAAEAPLAQEIALLIQQLEQLQLLGDPQRACCAANPEAQSSCSH